jgi:ABC-type branched-subunit amino acid transport system ATPase component
MGHRQITAELTNVRCIEEATIEIGKSRVTVLVGANNSGKSSILDTVSTLLWSLPGSTPGPNVFPLPSSFYRRAAGNVLRPQAKVKLHLSPEQNALVCEEVRGSLTTQFISACPIDEVQRGTATTTDFVPIAMTYKPDGADAYGLAGHQPSIHDVQNLKQHGGGHYWIDHSSYSASNWKMLGKRRQVTQHGGQTLQDMRSPKTPLGDELARLAAGTLYLRANRGVPSYAPANQITVLTPSTLHDLPRILLNLHYDEKRWLELEAAITQVFDEIRSVRLRDMGGSRALHALLDNNDNVAVDDLGFGVRSAVQILAILCAAPSEAIVLIDEPEQGLNQSRMRDFASVIEVLRPDVALLLATQSEPFCKGLSTRSEIVLAERSEGKTRTSRVELGISADRLRVAKAMGVDPLYLMEGGRILYVEGDSDEIVLKEWLSLNGIAVTADFEVHELGGNGNIGQEFAKPMFLRFKDRLFFLLDSDGSDDAHPLSPEMERRQRWFTDGGITNFRFLQRRELENYIGHELIAQATDIHPSSIQPPPGRERWHDIKKAVKAHKGSYNERHITVGAFNLLDDDRKKRIFENENDALLDAIRGFIRGAG